MERVRRDCYTTILPSRNSTSSMLCSRSLQPQSRTPHSLPRCSRCRTMAGIPLELTPQQRRQKTLEALTTQIEILSRQNPVLMIFEDAHWADPTSFEAFG